MSNLLQELRDLIEFKAQVEKMSDKELFELREAVDVLWGSIEKETKRRKKKFN